MLYLLRHHHPNPNPHPHLHPYPHAHLHLHPHNHPHLICSVLLQLSWSLVELSLIESASIASAFRLHHIVAIVIAWPIVIMICDEIAKRHDRNAYRRNQQRKRIVFDTKLGMHSPK